MKQFLYLDTDIVDSIIAQAEKGLIQNITVEKEEDQTIGKTNGRQISASAEGGGNLFNFIKASGELNGLYSSGHEESNTSATRGIVAKVMHDAAFDFAMERIQPQQTDNTSLSVGSYFTIKREFSFVDLAYLSRMFSDEALVSFLKESYCDEAQRIIDEIKQGTNRQQRRNNGFNEKEELKKLIEENNKQYDDAKTALDLFKSVSPYERMLISDDGYLLPLDDRYFRVNPSNLGFRYGGEIVCVGMVTNIISEENIETENIFLSLQQSINGALKALLPTNANNILVAHPIAVYYDIEEQGSQQ